MANLYAQIYSDRSHATRTSSQHISAQAETWKAVVRVDLLKDGDCTVSITNKNGGNRKVLWEGNADELAAQ